MAEGTSPGLGTKKISMRTRYSNGDPENEKATLKGTGGVVAVTGRRETCAKA